MSQWINAHRKAVTVVVGAAVYGIGNYFGVTSSIYAEACFLATALGVHIVPNVPQG